MYIKNSGKNESKVLQNQFTSFLAVSVNNAKLDYLRSRLRRLHRELLIEEPDIYFASVVDCTELFSDKEALDIAMQEIKENERYIVIARVLHDKGFEEIARELEMGYKGVAAIYYRAIKKLNKVLRGDDK